MRASCQTGSHGLNAHSEIASYREDAHYVFRGERMRITQPQLSAVDSNGKLGVLKLNIWQKTQLIFAIMRKEFQCWQTRLY